MPDFFLIEVSSGVIFLGQREYYIAILNVKHTCSHWGLAPLFECNTGVHVLRERYRILGGNHVANVDGSTDKYC